MILLAGVGAAAAVGAMPARPLKLLVAGLLVAAAGQLGWQSYRASYLMPADPQNPYVFAQTSAKITRLLDDLEEIAAASPEGRTLPIKVIWDSTITGRSPGTSAASSASSCGRTCPRIPPPRWSSPRRGSTGS